MLWASNLWQHGHEWLSDPEQWPATASGFINTENERDADEEAECGGTSASKGPSTVQTIEPIDQSTVPVYPRQSNPRRSKPERCTRAYYGLDDFYAARQASRFRPATA